MWYRRHVMASVRENSRKIGIPPGGRDMNRTVSGMCVWCLCAVLTAHDAAGQVWTHLVSFQSSSNYIRKIAADSSGAFFIGGYAFDSLMLDTMNITPSTVFTSNGRTDCFIMKTAKDCKPQILHRFGGPGNDLINDMVITDKQHFVVTGRFQETMTIGDSTLIAPVTEAFFIAELSDDSTPVWCSATNAFCGFCVDEAANGDILVAGQYREEAAIVPGQILAGTGDNDLFYARYDATGKPLWAIGAGGKFNDHTPMIGSGRHSGEFYVAGVFFDTLFFDGTADTIVSASDREQSFVYRLDGAGAVLWKKTLASDDYAICHSITVDSLGYLYVVGRYAGTFTIDTMSVVSGNEHSMFVARIAPDGTPLWIRSVDLAIGYHIGISNGSEVMITGTYQREVAFGAWSFRAKDIEDIFVVGYSLDGECTWVLDGGCCRTAMCTAAATNSRREFLAAGSVDGVLVGRFCNINFSGLSEDFDNESLGRTFLAAFDPHGDVVSRPQPSAVRQVTAAAKNCTVRYYDLYGRDVTGMMNSNERLNLSGGIRMLVRDIQGQRSMVTLVR